MQEWTEALARRVPVKGLLHLRGWIDGFARAGERLLRRDWTIRMHLAAFGFALLIPAVALGAIALQTYAEGERHRIENAAIDIAAAVSARVDDKLQDLISVLRTLATSPFLDAGDLAAFHERSRLALAGRNTYLVLIDASMRPLLSTRAAYGAAIPDIIARETVRAAMGGGRPEISNGFMDAALGEMAISVVVPVVRSGEIRYALAAVRPGRQLLGAKAPPAGDAHWLVGISDRHAVILDRSQDAAKFIGQTLSEDARRVSTGASGVHRGVNLEGVESLRAYVRSDLSGWMTAAFIPVSAVEAPMRRNWLLFVLATAALIALSIWAASHYARLIARPMDDLLAGARELGRGEPVKALNSTVREANVVARALAQASLERRRHDEHLRFVMHELMHRTKNLLALILSISRQSFSRSSSYDGFQKGLTGRLTALSRSMDILIASDWHGADVAGLIEAQLAPFADSRLSLSGPPVSLNAEGAQQIGLALHELATNATKHGALSVPGGNVRVAWNLTAPRKGNLRIVWQETGGPPVVPPAVRGFGRVVIEEGIAHTFRTDVRIDYAPEGVRWEAVVPWKYLVDREE